MAQTVIVHLVNEDPVLAEMEKMPEPGDTNVQVLYPRRIDGKPVHYLSNSATMVVFPLHRISSIEIVSEERAEEGEITFYRE